MIRLRLIRPDRTPQEFVFEGNVATIGRGRECDVVIDSPFVSKRHALILSGVVVVDLGSSNGTSIDGQRIESAAPYGGGVVSLGNESIRLEIDVDGARAVDESADPRADAEPPLEAAPPPAPVAPELVPGGIAPAATSASAAAAPASREAGGEFALVRAELERTRERAVELDGENERLRSAARERERADETRARQFDEEKADLRRRLDTLREEVENREVEASAELQVRMARARQAEIAADNDKLRARIAELEASALHVAGGRIDPASAARLERLEAALRASETNARELSAELESARAGRGAPTAALPASDLFQRLQSENAKLRAQLAEARGGQRGATALPGELFGELRAENEGLRRRVGDLEVAARERSSGDQSRTLEARAGLEREIDALRAENARLRTRTATSAGAATGAIGVEELLDLSAGDAAAHGAPADLDDERLIVLHGLRLLRNVERIVTRLAAGYVQVRATDTVLPESGKSLRKLATALLRGGGEVERRELEEHVERLGAWLAVSIGAPRQAAERFAFALKDELSERRLVENDPIPTVRKLAGQAEAELWRRACAHLSELSRESIEDRLEALTRICAHELYDGTRRDRS